MTTETLRAVALNVIDDYRRTAKLASSAFRQGSIKGLTKIDSTVGALLENYEGLVAKNLKKSIRSAQQRLTTVSDKADESVVRLGTLVKDGIHGTQKRVLGAAHRSESVVDMMLSGASRQIAKFPPKDTFIARLLGNSVATSVEPIGLSGARVLRFASSKIARGAEKLTNNVAGTHTPAAKKRAVRAKTAVKRAYTRRK
jgi:hypothetical protein